MLTAGVIVIADILTKYWISSTFFLHEVRPVVGDWIRLTYIHNPGAAFGLFPGSRFALIGVSVAAVIIVVAVAWNRRTDLRAVFPLGLILGGAIGNLIDRIRLGQVVDFVQVGIPPDNYWPVFNVADSAVTVGVIWLAAGLMVSGRDDEAEPADAHAQEEPVGRVASSRDDG